MTTPTAQELYEETVSRLPVEEQLRLAALILDQIAPAEAGQVDDSDEWSENDLREITIASIRHATQSDGSDER